MQAFHFMIAPHDTGHRFYLVPELLDGPAWWLSNM